MSKVSSGKARHSGLLGRYFAGTGELALFTLVIFLAVLAADIACELAARSLPADGSGLRLWFLGIARLDDARSLGAIRPGLGASWALALVLAILLLLPLAARIGGRGRIMMLTLGLVAGGSGANELALAGQGAVHNWIAIILPNGHLLTAYSLADLAQIAGISIFIALTVMTLLEEVVDQVAGWRKRAREQPEDQPLGQPRL